jgi:hypothetical protein
MAPPTKAKDKDKTKAAKTTAARVTAAKVATKTPSPRDASGKVRRQTPRDDSGGPSPPPPPTPFSPKAFGSSPQFNADNVIIPPAATEDDHLSTSSFDDDMDVADVEAMLNDDAAEKVDAAPAEVVAAAPSRPAFIKEVIDDPDLLAALMARAADGDHDAVIQLGYNNRLIARMARFPEAYAAGKTDEEVKVFEAAALRRARAEAMAASGGVSRRPPKRNRPVSSPSGHTPLAKAPRQVSAASSSSSTTASLSAQASGRSFAEVTLPREARGCAAAALTRSARSPPSENFPFLLHVHNNVHGTRDALTGAEFLEVRQFLVASVLEHSKSPTVQLRVAYVVWNEEYGYGKIACLDSATRAWYILKLQEFNKDGLLVAGWEPVRPPPLHLAFLNVEDVGPLSAQEILQLIKAFNRIPGTVSLRRQDVFENRVKRQRMILLNLDEVAVASLKAQVTPWEVHLGLARRRLHCPSATTRQVPTTSATPAASSSGTGTSTSATSSLPESVEVEASMSTQ